MIQRCAAPRKRRRFLSRRYLPLYMIMLPAIVYFIVYRYIPMGGLVMVFKNFRLTRGIFASEWCGWNNFIKLLNTPGFDVIFSNTVTISLLKLLFGFPAPIIVALMLNEVRSSAYKRTLQTTLYMPHFISWVVLGNLVFTFFAPATGIVPAIANQLFGVKLDLMMNPAGFRGLLVGSDIWKEVGWGSIIYLATLAGIDHTLYEAAVVDGANKRSQLLYITLPCLLPTIMTMLLLRVGRIMDAGFEQIFVMQNPMVYDASEILDTYIYKVSFIQGQHAMGATAGLIKSVIGLIFVVSTNAIAKRFDQQVI